MALMGIRHGCNFGYGRQMNYARPQALKDMLGEGHYGTVKAHCGRWLAFVKWCGSVQGPGINTPAKNSSMSNGFTHACPPMQAATTSIRPCPNS